MLQILINFLQVTGIAVFINVEWTAGVLKTLGVAGRNLDLHPRNPSTLAILIDAIISWECHNSRRATLTTNKITLVCGHAQQNK